MADRTLVRQVLMMVPPVTLTYTVDGLSNLIPLWMAGQSDPTGYPATVEMRIAAVGLGNTALTFVAFVLGSGWTGVMLGNAQ
eukprot:1398112-Amphidinium_carterae.1